MNNQEWGWIVTNISPVINNTQQSICQILNQSCPIIWQWDPYLLHKMVICPISNKKAKWHPVANTVAKYYQHGQQDGSEIFKWLTIWWSVTLTWWQSNIHVIKKWQSVSHMMTKQYSCGLQLDKVLPTWPTLLKVLPTLPTRWQGNIHATKQDIYKLRSSILVLRSGAVNSHVSVIRGLNQWSALMARQKGMVFTGFLFFFIN